MIINKEDFVKYMDALKKCWDLNSEISNVCYKYNADFSIIDFPDCTDALLDLIGTCFEKCFEKYFESANDFIGWWCYETDFGRNDLAYVKSNDTIYHLDTAEKLYDFLVGDNDVK